MKKYSNALVLLSLLLTQILSAQVSDIRNENSVELMETVFPCIGRISPRNVTEIEASNWLIGCETLDRDFADYDAYKEYLPPLGIKKIRLQAGWSKTEKQKGIYNWAWLDHIVDDACSRGLEPWIQTSYGNALYKGGGGTNLGAGMPLSEEALKAWSNWVKAMVSRYKDRVFDWEIWNEPNFGDNSLNSPETVADFNILTAEIIKKIQPEARISGLALGHIGLEFAEDFFKHIAEKNKAYLFDNMTYHDYAYNPDANYHEVYLLNQVMQKYLPGMKLRQGENGAPSNGGEGRGALGDYNWTELSQAKWDTRRMLGNLGHDIECCIFSIIEMAYTYGPIHRLNYKGIIQSDSTKQAIRPKQAYFAIQNICSVFDNKLEKIPDLKRNHHPENAGKGEYLYDFSTDRSLSVYGFRDKTTKKQVFSLWMDDAIPTNSIELKNIRFSLSNAAIDHPVLVDILSGKVWEIPKENISRENGLLILNNIPVYDAPILISDISLLKIRYKLHPVHQNH